MFIVPDSDNYLTVEADNRYIARETVCDINIASSETETKGKKWKAAFI